MAGIDSAGTMPFRLRYGNPPKTQLVVRKRISWYDLPQTKVGAHLGMPVITVQPTANEDADLYVLEGSGADFGDGAGLIGSSTRLPSASGGIAGGYAPDWVAWEAGRTRGAPTAQVAVYGDVDDPAVRKHYLIETDWAWELQVDGTPLRPGGQVQFGSDWNFFEAHSGNPYTVHMTAHAGDPDLYVYGDESTEYVGGDATVGGGSVAFAATMTGRHFVRAYGFGPSNNDAEVWVTSP